MLSYNHFICVLTIIVLFIIIYNDYKKISHYESIEKYYKWRNCILKPPHSGKYLLQYTTEEDDEYQVIVTHYNARTEQWILPNNTLPVAWCHLPNYLYPDKKG